MYAEGIPETETERRNTMKIMRKIAEKQADLYQPPVTIAFLGDSVTQGCFEVYRTEAGEVQTVFERAQSYSAKLEALLAMLYPSVPVQIINAGISGDCAPRGLARLERDVLAFHPDLTVVAFGLNDVCREDETMEEYLSALDGIFARLDAAGSEVIFMTPNMMNTRMSDRLHEPEIRKIAADTMAVQTGGELGRYLDAAKALCAARGVRVCDCYEKWMRLAESGVDTTALLANAINHPTREMHWLFANALLEELLR